MATEPVGASPTHGPYWPPPGLERALDAVARPLRGHERAVMAGLLVVAVLGPVALWTHGGGPLSGAPTRIVALPPGTIVRAEDGTLIHAHVGMTLPRNTLIRTGSGDGTLVVLDTRGRRVTLGDGSGLQVDYGGRQELLLGTVVVDSRNGPQLTLVDNDTVAEVAGGSLARITWMQATSYAGTTRISTTVDGTTQQVTVARWHRADRAAVTYDLGIARLANDDLDSLAEPDVVADELALRDLSAPLLDPRVAATVRARLLPLAGKLPAGATDNRVSQAVTALASSETPLADTAMCVAISAVGGTPLRTLLAWRADGGAWVAIAGLGHADVTAVTARFTELRAALLPSTTPPGTNPSGAQPTTGTSSTPTTTTPTPTRTTTPSPTRSSDVVDGVVNQLPGNAATPVRSNLPANRPPVTTPPTVPFPRSAYWNALLSALS